MTTPDYRALLAKLVDAIDVERVAANDDCVSVPAWRRKRDALDASIAECKTALAQPEAPLPKRVAELRDLVELAVHEQGDLQGVLDELCAIATPGAALREAAIARIVQQVAELPDRSSPEDWPEAMMVTAEELTVILRTALAATPAPTEAPQPAARAIAPQTDPQAIARLRERAEMAERERDEVTRQLNGERADHVRIAVAAGVFYENDYSGPTRGPVDAVVKEIEALVKDRAAADRLRSLDQAVRAYRRKERELLGLPDGALEEDHLQAIARLRTAQNERAIPPTEPEPAADPTGELFDVAMKERKERLALAKQLAEAQAERDAKYDELNDVRDERDAAHKLLDASAEACKKARVEIDAARAEHRASLERLREWGKTRVHKNGNIGKMELFAVLDLEDAAIAKLPPKEPARTVNVGGVEFAKDELDEICHRINTRVAPQPAPAPGGDLRALLNDVVCDGALNTQIAAGQCIYKFFDAIVARIEGGK